MVYTPLRKCRSMFPSNLCLRCGETTYSESDGCSTCGWDGTF